MDGSGGRRALAAALLLQFAFGLTYVWGALVPYVQLSTDWSAWMIGAVWSAVPLGFGTGMIGAGRLADTHPARMLCGGAVALMIIGFSIAFALPSWPTLTVCYAGIGLGAGAALALAGSVAAGTHYYPEYPGTVGGALTGMYALSPLILIPVVTHLAAARGWLDALRMAGVGVIVLGLFSVFLMPPVPRPEARRGSRMIAPQGTPLLETRAWIGFVFEVLAVVPGAAAIVDLGVYARDLDIPLSLAAGAITVVGVGNGLGRIGAGRAADLFGVRRVMAAILACDLAAMFALWQAGGAGLVFAAAVFAGIGLGGPAGIAPRLAAGTAPQAPHSALGILIAGYSTGSFGGPLLLAAAGVDRSGWLALAACPLAALGMLSTRTAWRT